MKYQNYIAPDTRCIQVKTSGVLMQSPQLEDYNDNPIFGAPEIEFF